MLQGYCFPVPALKTAWWIGLDKGYLSALYKALRAHDEYLWKYRDPAGTGCLQSWCVWDTGEDNGVRFGKADDSWSGETPPCFERMPFYSMDVMSYSYDGRKTLARISEAARERRGSDVAGKGGVCPPAAARISVAGGKGRVLRPRPVRKLYGYPPAQQPALHVSRLFHAGYGGEVRAGASSQSERVLDAFSAAVRRRKTIPRSAISERTTGAGSRRALPTSARSLRWKITGFIRS